ncbi:hypothetical protein JYU34_017327 [Plutella xylostella]|uniref:NADH dehydrogenase [ubiquinone] 1 beta subcomplex subunit 4 n=2 Tax=Plutella xylostella TaxID=51655 RepID=A0A8S4FVD8_PLUXY|nr:uncharacterized protein LOC105388946 [Plutella xylostella]KAG7298872.1 hypothetical protein JYU34_017327 [Plutella xylostella]CAG9132615.1 unnamed protein product [Plutella xylostella]
MANNYGISEQQLNLIKVQTARRAEMRREFLKQRTNPFKHASEAGYVFDPAVQKYISMKVTRFDHFKPNRSNSLFGITAIIIPMCAYAYWIVTDRNAKEQKIRNGELRYRDRLFKLA